MADHKKNTILDEMKVDYDYTSPVAKRENFEQLSESYQSEVIEEPEEVYPSLPSIDVNYLSVDVDLVNSDVSSMDDLLNLDAIPDEGILDDANIILSNQCKTKKDIQLEIRKRDQKKYVSAHNLGIFSDKKF